MSDGYKAAELYELLSNHDGEFDADIDSILSNSKGGGDVLIMLNEAGRGDGMLANLLRKHLKSDMLRTARKQGDVTSMSAATGFSDSGVDATGYEMLVNSMLPAAQQMLIKGPKGSGKTTKALDVARHLHAEMDGELNVLTNIKKNEDEEIEHEAVDYADTISGMLQWIKETSGEKLVIGDEWSSTVNAHSQGSGEVGKTFARFINALRKGEGGSTRLMVIGHEHDTDIAKILRTQSDVVVEADGKQREGLIDQATVFKGWDDYLHEDDWVTIRGMQDVPERSPWAVSTNYFATFELDLDNPEKQIRKGKLVDDWGEYQDDDEDEDSVGNSVKHVQCRGTKTDGSECNSSVKHESGYCHAHRHQWDKDVEGTDPRLE